MQNICSPTQALRTPYNASNVYMAKPTLHLILVDLGHSGSDWAAPVWLRDVERYLAKHAKLQELFPEEP